MSSYLQKTSKVLHRVAISIFIVIFMSNSAFAGSIILTGHDTDDHQAGNFMNWALTALLNNGDGSARPIASENTSRIGYIGNSSANLSNYLGFYDNFEFYDLDNANWIDAFTDSNDALVIGTGGDFVFNSGITALTGGANLFETYFNAGGNLFVNTHQGTGNSFYGFLPPVGNVNASNLTSCFQESGNGLCMAPSAAGSTSGLLLTDIVQASITHNQFDPDPAFTSPPVSE